MRTDDDKELMAIGLLMAFLLGGLVTVSIFIYKEDAREYHISKYGSYESDH